MYDSSPVEDGVNSSQEDRPGLVVEADDHGGGGEIPPIPEKRKLKWVSGPIRSQYSGPWITLDQSEARILTFHLLYTSHPWDLAAFCGLRSCLTRTEKQDLESLSCQSICLPWKEQTVGFIMIEN